MSPNPTHLNVIITGATGMVGEGVLLTCLEHPAIASVLLVSRKPYPLQHPKLKECIVRDFMHLDDVRDQLTGYDACFFCAGISSVGLSEADYTHITYDITLNFAGVLAIPTAARKEGSCGRASKEELKMRSPGSASAASTIFAQVLCAQLPARKISS
jgi:nucleoside-diphosphate-sugar epimerase